MELKIILKCRGSFGNMLLYDVTVLRVINLCVWLSIGILKNVSYMVNGYAVSNNYECMAIIAKELHNCCIKIKSYLKTSLTKQANSSSRACIMLAI